jgi:hypothetical protein
MVQTKSGLLLGIKPVGGVSGATASWDDGGGWDFDGWDGDGWDGDGWDGWDGDF